MNKKPLLIFILLCLKFITIKSSQLENLLFDVMTVIASNLCVKDIKNLLSTNHNFFEKNVLFCNAKDIVKWGNVCDEYLYMDYRYNTYKKKTFFEFAKNNILFIKKLLPFSDRLKSPLCLHAELDNNHVNIHRLKILIAFVDFVDNQDASKRIPLHIAVKQGRNDIVQLLLDKTTQIDAVDDKGRSSLFIAAQYNHEIILQMLIDNYAHVNIADLNGRTPLGIAINKGYRGIILKLIQNGADKSLEGRYSISQKGCYPKIYKQCSPDQLAKDKNLQKYLI